MDFECQRWKRVVMEFKNFAIKQVPIGPLKNTSKHFPIGRLMRAPGGPTFINMSLLSQRSKLC